MADAAIAYYRVNCGARDPRHRPVKDNRAMRLRSGGLRAAMVDLDGTLVDTMGDFDVAINAMLRELGLPAISAAEIERRIGRGSEHLVQSVLAHAGAPAEAFPRAWATYQSTYLAINGEHARVYTGVVEGLEALRRLGLRLACLTNKPTAFALPLLEAKGLSRYFDLSFGAEAFERRKPDPLPLAKTCEALGTVPAETLMVGDSSNDAKAARAAGCPVVLVTYGYNHGEPVRDVDADGFVDSLAELPALMRQLFV